MGNQRTITLTGRRPVRIDAGDWPVIAESAWRNSQHWPESEANQDASATIKARQHADGRMLVYGVYRYQIQVGLPCPIPPAYPGAEDEHAAAGTLLAAPVADEQAIGAIRDTADYLAARTEGSCWAPDWDSLADAVIASLPAESLS